MVLDRLGPDSAQLADHASTWRSAYVHIPFCARVCPYCDFAVVAGQDDQATRYVDAVIAEIDGEQPWFPLDAVFVGGGTPSRLPVEDLARILEALDRRFGLAEECEVTLEANPEDWTPELSDGLVAAGFNRVSFGVQSFDPLVLNALGRLHSPDQASAAVGIAHASGFASVSLDLIYGHPRESEDSWRRTLDESIALAPDHVSAYALTVEPGTQLWKQVRSGAPAPDDDVQADRWEEAAARLSSAGYVRYEISNHAKPGHGCRYNLAVWGQAEYLAFGLGAHGFRDGVRSRRVRRLPTYVDRVLSGIGGVQETELIEGWNAELERLMLGLRRTAGVMIGDGGRALLSSDEGRRLVELGVLGVIDDRLFARDPLLTDEIIRAALGLEPPS